MPTVAEQRAGLAAITVTQFALVFMLSAVAVAVPALGREFGARAAELGLVESGYIASVAMLLLPVTRLSDMFGRGFVFALGVAVFTVTSLVLPISQSIGQFILVRVFQGAGGAMMVTTGLAIIADLYPGKGRGRALGISTAGVYLGLSVGPLLGGLITTHWGWRWIFYLGAIPCALCFVLTIKSLRVRPIRTRMGSFDWLGALFVGLGMVGISQGGSHFHDMWGRLMLGGGFASLAAFVAWEARVGRPLLDLRLFTGNGTFAGGNLVQFMNYAATFGITFLISLYLQIVRGMTAGDAGLVLMAQPLVMAALSPVAGGLADKMAPHKLSAFGMSLAAIALGVAAMLGVSTPLWAVVVSMVLCGAGTAFFATANMSVIMGSVGPSHYGVASAMVAGMRTTGMTLSLVTISVVLSVLVGPQEMTAANTPEFMRSMHLVLGGFTALCVAGVPLCLRAALKER